MFELYSDSSGMFYSIFSGVEQAPEKAIDNSSIDVIIEQNRLINSIGKILIGLLIAIMLILILK